MIQSTSSSDGTSGPKAILMGLQGSVQQGVSQERDSLSTSQADQLKSALASTPEIRPEVVERGRALAADPSYPSASVIQGLAAMIVNSADDDGDGS